MSSNRRAAEVNGFGMHSLRVEQAWLLYSERYPTPPDYRVPSGARNAAISTKMTPKPQKIHKMTHVPKNFTQLTLFLPRHQPWRGKKRVN